MCVLTNSHSFNSLTQVFVCITLRENVFVEMSISVALILDRITQTTMHEFSRIFGIRLDILT